MGVHSESFEVRTKGNTDVLDITSKVSQAVKSSGLKSGLVTVFVPGSTAGVTTIEYEPGLVGDIRKVCEKLIPQDASYGHNRGGEDNGHAHLRSSLLGTSLSVPFKSGELLLGTWQQVVFLDFDTRPRSRKVVLQVMGE